MSSSSISSRASPTSDGDGIVDAADTVRGKGALPGGGVDDVMGSSACANERNGPFPITDAPCNRGGRSVVVSCVSAMPISDMSIPDSSLVYGTHTHDCDVLMGVAERGTSRGVAAVCREAGRSREASSRRHCSLNGLWTSDGVAGRVFSMCWRFSHQCEKGLTVFMSRTSVCALGAAAVREERDGGRRVSRVADRCEGLVTDPK